MLIIPIQPFPNQLLETTIGDQNCTIHIYQKRYGMFMDVSVNDSLIIGGVICENLNRIVRSKYLNFVGDLCFIDSQGLDDPYYTGLGSRWKLFYLETSDLKSFGLIN